MMENPKLSLLGQADTGLARGVCGLLGGLKHLTLWLLGLTGLAGCFGLIFEYGEGLADISLHEWGFMLLLVALTWRHVHYSRRFGYGFWRGLARWLGAQGIVFGIGLIALGLIVWLSLEFLGHAKFLNELDLVGKEGDVQGLALALLAMYLGAPTRPRKAAHASPEATSIRREPTLSSSPDKEVSL
ncbi:hypothetical protein E5198_01030 [Pseudomonas sp. A-1]|uniref:hypothetical protein n=1 Tax=Pseudomonas sp. A-1 TaxID=1821274 RepID=UPI0010A6583A|nr:hypothetical protein [Pseudomonas sp. A-1]THG87126.1 hypothetical protein E5198_01030 [Pseudomonas sp. A-1]